MTSVFIDGAAGTTGLEIRERLAGRADLSLIELDDAQRKDAGARKQAFADADVAVLCLPDDAAREAMSLINAGTRVIDASSAHRTDSAWTYGFPELGFDVAGATRVSNPGCYPTGFLALVAPLVRARVIPADWPLTVNAVSGYSGGGKALIERVERDPLFSFRTYGLDLAHKHVPEMREHAGLTHAPVFSPAVARAFRGMIVEVPLSLEALPRRPSASDLLQELGAFYDGQPVVSVHADAPGELMLTRDGVRTDRLDLFIARDPEDRQVRLIATLDNLGKGAAGAAVQSLNLMAGLDPLAGLVL